MCCDNEQKNVLYIFNDTGFGGAGQSLLDILVEIRNKVNPIVIIPDNAAVEDKLVEIGIQYYKIHFSTDYAKIGNINETKKKLNIMQSYENALQILPIIEKEKIQLIHINSSVSSFAAIAALIMHIPYIWHIRELLEEQFNCEFLNKELKKELYATSDQLITISSYVQKRYMERYGVGTLRMYNGLNIQKFKIEFDGEKDFNNIFLVGAMITPEKGQWDVIRAAEMLIKRGYTDIKVIIVGQGRLGYVWALKKYIARHGLEGNICILPFQDDLSKLRKQASYAITCSQNEALGRVTIEAMLAGNVVIGARSGGTTEIIGENEERGFLYELHSVSGLADTMLRAMQCPDQVKNMMAKKAQKYAENTFDSKQYCRELFELYNEKISSFMPKDAEKLLIVLKDYYKKNKDLGEHVGLRDVNPYKKKALLYALTVKWLEIKQKGYSLGEYFMRNSIYSVAIYGMGVMGCLLYDELEESEISIKYLIDKNPNGMEKVLDIASLDGERLDVDAVVVTVVLGEQQIIDEICGKGYERVIGIREILNELETNLALRFVI